MGERFRNPIVVQGAESLDHRIFSEFTYRDFPLPMRWCPKDMGGHDEAVSVAVFETAHLASEAEHKEFDYKGPGQLWIGEGEYLDGVPEAEQAAIRARAGTAFLSVDPGAAVNYRTRIKDADGNDVEMAEVEEAYMKAFQGDEEAEAWLATLYELAEFDTYHVGAVTQVDIPCFPECRIMLASEASVSEEADRVAASARARKLMRRLAAGPVKMPADWYQPVTLDRYTPFTISDEGRIQGHLCGWNACHRGFANHCERPDYQTDFDEFHTGWVALDDGERLRVGVVTHVDGHCASIDAYTRAVEDPACQLGTVRLHSDRYGIQMCGSVHPDVTPSQVTRALAAAPSGDWRGPAAGRRLHAIALVNEPGYTAYVEEDINGAATRMVASLPKDLFTSEHDMAFFDVPDDVLTAACACNADLTHEAAPIDTDCGCGNHEGACTCDQPKLSAEDLLNLARLDATMDLRKAAPVGG